MPRRRWRLALLGLLLPLGGAAAQETPEPLGVWRLEPAALKALGERMGTVMAKAVSPDERRRALTAAKELEGRYAQLLRQDTAAARRLEPELRAARVEARAMSDPKSFFQAQFLASLGNALATTLELQDDGTVLARSVLDGEPRMAEGAWFVRDGEIELLAALPAAAGGATTVLHLRGSFGADRMELKQAEEKEDPALRTRNPELAKAMRDAVWVLVRAR